DLLVQLPVRGLLECLACQHAALRKLPAAAADLATEKHLARVPDQHNADVSAKTVRVYDIAHELLWSLPQGLLMRDDTSRETCGTRHCSLERPDAPACARLGRLCRFTPQRRLGHQCAAGHRGIDGRGG